MQDRTYGDLFKLASALIGTGGVLDTSEQDQLSYFINRRFQQAFDESPVWPRYLVSSEKREIYSYNVSGITSGQHAHMNQNYKLLGLNSGRNIADDADIGKSATNVYQGGSTDTTFIYKNTSNAWVIATSINSFEVGADGTISLESAGTVKFTEADTVKKDLIQNVVTWTENHNAVGPPIISLKNLIPYAETGKNSIGDFNRIHRKAAFLNDSSLEYEFFVDFDGANILNISNTSDTSAFVSYKKQFTPFAAQGTPYESTEAVPGEFFNFISHAVYADFLRVQNKQEQAIAEEQVATSYLFQELEKIDLRSNNNSIGKKFSTYVNKQSR
tara:strand:+ start:3676 stop:4662 length:987 start_codon:yes stop_codon:yes gene_type:complete